MKKNWKKREDNGESTIILTSLPVHCLNSSTCNTDTFAKKTKMAKGKERPWIQGAKKMYKKPLLKHKHKHKHAKFNGRIKG